jgi:hypothetical protein
MERLKVNMPAWEVLGRPIRIADPNYSMGVYALNWLPQEATAEIGGGIEPVLSTYNLRIQNLIKNTDEAEGRADFTVAAKSVRAIVARDTTLRDSFPQLQETLFGVRERLLRYGIRQQNFLNNDIKGTFTFLSTTDLWAETETVQL